MKWSTVTGDDFGRSIRWAKKQANKVNEQIREKLMSDEPTKDRAEEVAAKLFPDPEAMGPENLRAAIAAALREYAASETQRAEQAEAKADWLEQSYASLKMQLRVCDEIRAERDALRADKARLEQRIKDDNKSYGYELRDPAGTVWDECKRLQADKARLDWLEANSETSFNPPPLKRMPLVLWTSGVSMRAAIDAARQQEGKP